MYTKQIILGLLCMVICLGAQVLQAQELVGNIITSMEELDGTGDAVAISDDGNRIIVGTPLHPLYTPDRVGYARVYQLMGDTWEQLGQDLTGEGENDEFGNSVCISSDGNRIAIGGSLGVVVYDLVGSDWEQIGGKMILPGMSVSSEVESIRLSNDKKTIAFSGNSSSTSSIIVYEFTGNEWVQKGDNLPSNSRAQFGLSADGNRIVFYACCTGPNNDRYINVMEYQDNKWNKLGSTINLPGAYRWADGIDISGNGNRVVFSIENRDNSADGAIATFDWSGNDWVQIDPLIDHTIFTSFGVTLRLSNDGNAFVISNTYDFSVVDETTVAVYQFVDETWSLLGDNLYGPAHDETAEGQVDITADGSRIVLGGVKTGPNDNRGFVKVYDYQSLTAVNSKPNRLDVRLFPNPVGDRLHIKWNESGEKMEIQILDALGKQVEEQIVNGEAHAIEMPVSPGLYFVKLKPEHGEARVFKVIRQ